MENSSIVVDMYNVEDDQKIGDKLEGKFIISKKIYTYGFITNIKDDNILCNKSVMSNFNQEYALHNTPIIKQEYKPIYIQDLLKIMTKKVSLYLKPLMANKKKILSCIILVSIICTIFLYGLSGTLAVIVESINYVKSAVYNHIY